MKKNIFVKSVIIFLLAAIVFSIAATTVFAAKDDKGYTIGYSFKKRDFQGNVAEVEEKFKVMPIEKKKWYEKEPYHTLYAAEIGHLYLAE